MWIWIWALGLHMNSPETLAIPLGKLVMSVNRIKCARRTSIKYHQQNSAFIVNIY